MEQFIRDYGVFALLLWAMFENDVVFVMAGVAFELGLVQPVSAGAAVLCGSMIHDFVWYGVGRHRSDWIRGTDAYRSVGPHIERWVRKFGVWELFVCRFVYGTRYPSFLFWGVQKLPIWKFSAVNLGGLVVWCAILSSLGYFLGDGAKAVIHQVKTAQSYLVGAVVLVLLAVALRKYVFRKRGAANPVVDSKRKQEEPAGKSEA